MVLGISSQCYRRFSDSNYFFINPSLILKRPFELAFESCLTKMLIAFFLHLYWTGNLQGDEHMRSAAVQTTQYISHTDIKPSLCKAEANLGIFLIEKFSIWDCIQRKDSRPMVCTGLVRSPESNARESTSNIREQPFKPALNVSSLWSNFTPCSWRTPTHLHPKLYLTNFNPYWRRRSELDQLCWVNRSQEAGLYITCLGFS